MRRIIAQAIIGYTGHGTELILATGAGVFFKDMYHMVQKKIFIIK
jgi:hypothetical protein